MFSQDDMQELLTYEGNGDGVISVYLDTDSARQSTEAIKLTARGLLKEVQPQHEKDAQTIERYLELGYDWSKPGPVSYTHLDVYKRQVHARRGAATVHDGQAQPALVGRRFMGQRPHQRAYNAERLGERLPAQSQRFVKVLGGHGVGHGLGLGQGYVEPGARQLVALHADDERLAIGIHGRDGLDGFRTQHRAQIAVEGAGRAAALDVAQHGDARVFAQTIFQHLLDVLGGDLLAVAVGRAFGDDDHDVCLLYTSMDSSYDGAGLPGSLSAAGAVD